MRSRTSFWVFVAALFATATAGPLLPLSAPSARAQIRIPSETAGGDQEVATLLQRGQQLERERRWSEAVAIYEDAVKQYPARRDLQDRAILARAHFDVARRYGDDSFQKSLGAPQDRTLEAYAEVVQKIGTHYVSTPGWHDLIRRGTFMLEVALTEPVFLEKHLPNVPADRINAFRAELRQLTDRKTVNSRHEAKELVASAAQLAQRQIRLPATAVIWEYVCGAMGAMDEYSGFLTPAQLDDVFSQIEGNFVGLGIELKSETEALLIVNVIGGSPADKGGLKRGERIVAVDGQTVAQISADSAADLLKGAEGTRVRVELVDSQNARRDVVLLRERVEVPSVEDAKIVDPDSGVGYFRLSSFQKTTSRDVDAALWQLHRQGMKSLIVDVRGNPGGLLTAAVDVADKFLTAGTIVRTHGRNQNEDFDYKAHNAGTWRMPLVVLIDGDSASASEIFAGAIHDHQRGKTVGQRSYGKGSVQGIFPLGSCEAGVRLTTAKFFSPSGRAISNNGVLPDIEVQKTAKPVLDGAVAVSTGPAEDATLQAGIQAARTQLTQRP